MKRDRAKYRILLSLPLAVVLAACGHSPPAEMAAAPESPGSVHEAADKQSPELPATALDSDLLFDLLLGEIAAQRGELSVAAEALSRAASTSQDFRVAERATRIALRAKRYDTAIESAQLWAELRPDAGAPQEAVAVVMVEQGEIAKATATFQRLLSEKPDRVGPIYRRVAELLSRQSNQDGAVEVMQRLVRVNPDNPEAHYSLAFLADRFKRSELMGSAINRALELKPGWEDAALAKMSYLATHKDGKATVSGFVDSFLESHPRADKLRLHYARFLVDQGDSEKAFDQFSTLVDSNPNNADATFAAGLLSIQLDRLDAATEYLLRNLKIRPDNDQVRLYLGQVAMEQERYQDAEKWYREINDERFYLEAQVQLGAVIAQLRGIEPALQHLRGLHPRNEQEYVRLVLSQEQVLRRAKDLQQAKAVLDGAIDRFPENTELLYSRGLISAQLDLLEVHEQDMRKLLARDPQNAHALNALGYTLADSTDRYEEAHELIKQALAIRPDDPFILDSMGWVQYRLGNHDLAIKFLEQALAKRPDAEIAAHLGEVLWVVGQRSRAQEIWDEAIKQHPDNDVLQATIKKLRQ